jgi:hypothetical protein
MINLQLSRNSSTSGQEVSDRPPKLFMLIEWILIKSLPRLRLCRKSALFVEWIRRVDEMAYYVSMNTLPSTQIYI